MLSGVIAACWYGKRNERPILAMHGWQDNAGSFALLAPILSPHVAVLAIDLPGHGRSSHFPGGTMYHTIDFVRVIKEIMLYFKWSKVSLMGHSMSCAIIYHFAALYPDLVDMIISIDVLHTRYFPVNLQIDMLNVCLERFIKETERKLNKSNENNEPPVYTFPDLEQILHEASEKSVDINKCKYILERNVTESKREPNKYYLSRDGGVKYLIEYYTEPELTKAMAKRIRNIKWLVLKAEYSYHLDENKPCTKSVLEILKENNPDFYFHIIKGAKHHCHLNNAEKVSEYILPFLKKYRQPEYLNYNQKSKL